MKPLSKAGPSSHTRRAFSLIELLVVMGIMAVIMALMAPAIIGIGRANALNAAGNTVANIALLARQNSLTKNALTALVVITTSEADAVALYEIVPRTDGTPVSTADWTQLGRWEKLPEGIVIDERVGNFNKNSVDMSPTFPPLRYQGRAVGTFQYIVFLPSGALCRQNSPASIHLVEGSRTPGTLVADFTGAKKKNGAEAAANFYDISIITATGRLKVDRF